MKRNVEHYSQPDILYFLSRSDDTLFFGRVSRRRCLC